MSFLITESLKEEYKAMFIRTQNVVLIFFRLLNFKIRQERRGNTYSKCRFND
jgi:hypothetical protein